MIQFSFHSGHGGIELVIDGSDHIVDLIQLSFHSGHGSIELVIDGSDQIEGHQIFFGQFLQGALGSILGGGPAAVDFILQAFVAACNGTEQTAQAPLV